MDISTATINQSVDAELEARAVVIPGWTYHVTRGACARHATAALSHGSDYVTHRWLPLSHQPPTDWTAWSRAMGLRQQRFRPYCLTSDLRLCALQLASVGYMWYLGKLSRLPYNIMHYKQYRNSQRQFCNLKATFKNFVSPLTKNADNVCGIRPRFIFIAGVLQVCFYYLPLYGTSLFNHFILDMLTKSCFKRQLISSGKILFYYILPCFLLSEIQ